MKTLLLLLLVACACSQMTEHEWERPDEGGGATALDTTAIEQPVSERVGPTPSPSTRRQPGRRSPAHRETSLEPSASQPAGTSGASRSPLYGSLFCYECPPEFLRLGNGCYYFSKRMETWTMAHFECRTRGSQLAVVDSAWEDRVVRGHLGRRAMTRLNRWIGGIYDWSQEQWVWGGSGEVMKYTGFLKRSTISRRWQCAYMSPELFYRWNHTKCTNTMHYICEAPFQVTPRTV